MKLSYQSFLISSILLIPVAISLYPRNVSAINQFRLKVDTGFLERLNKTGVQEDVPDTPSPSNLSPNSPHFNKNNSALALNKNIIPRNESQQYQCNRQHFEKIVYSVDIPSIDGIIIPPDPSQKNLSYINPDKRISVSIPDSSNSSPSLTARNQFQQAAISKFYTIKDQCKVLSGDNCKTLQNNSDSGQTSKKDKSKIKFTGIIHNTIRDNILPVTINGTDYIVFINITYNPYFTYKPYIRKILLKNELNPLLISSEFTKPSLYEDHVVSFPHFISPCILEPCDPNEPHKEWCTYHRNRPNDKWVIQGNNHFSFAFVESFETEGKLLITPSNFEHITMPWGDFRANATQEEIDAYECKDYEPKGATSQIGSHTIPTSTAPVSIAGELRLNMHGIPIGISNRSGTYQPDSTIMRENMMKNSFLKVLLENNKTEFYEIDPNGQ